MSTNQKDSCSQFTHGMMMAFTSNNFSWSRRDLPEATILRILIYQMMMAVKGRHSRSGMKQRYLESNVAEDIALQHRSV